MKKLIIGLITILSLSACDKSSDNEGSIEWQGTFLDMKSGYGWPNEYLESDLPSELLNMLQYSTLEKDSAVVCGIGGCSTKSDYNIRISKSKCYITINETSQGDSLMEIRHYTFYIFEKGIFDRAEVTEDAIILDKGAWKLKLPAPFQYYFSKRTGREETKPFSKTFHYSGEFKSSYSNGITILENKDYTFELSDNGTLARTKPTYQAIGELERK